MFARLWSDGHGSFGSPAGLTSPVSATRPAVRSPWRRRCPAGHWSLLLVGAFDFGMASPSKACAPVGGRRGAGTQQALYDPRAWQDATLMELTALSEYTGTAVTSADPARRSP